MRHALTTMGCCAVVLTALSLRAEAVVAAPASGAQPCADPAAEIEIALISKTGPSTGRVRITGVVKNVGSAAWVATSPAQRLQMVLAQQSSADRPDTEPVEPAIVIAQLKLGEQFKIDHQVNWDARTGGSYPKFILRIFDTGATTLAGSTDRDCRRDNDRKEITAADIDKLFGPVPSSSPLLKLLRYHLLGGVGVNTVAATLGYERSSSVPGEIRASVAAPYSGIAEEVPIMGKAGTASIRVNIPCDRKQTSDPPPPPVTIIYRLWGSTGLPGASSWVLGSSIEQSIPYGKLCPARSGSWP